MPTPITAAPKHTGVDINRPVPGEPAAMETGPAPLAPEFQKIVDRLEMYLLATLGEMRGGETFRVTTGGSATTGAAQINAIDRLVITDADGVTWAVAAPDGVEFLASTDYPGGTLPNNDWIYAYVGVDTDGETLISELSADEPDDSMMWKEGAEGTRRYVGCFRTSSTGAPFPVTCVRGRCLYQRSAIASVTGELGSNGLRAVDANAAVGHTDLDLTSRIPPHARVAVVYGQVTVTSPVGGSNSDSTLGLYSAADTTSVAQGITARVQNADENSANSSLAEVVLSGGQAMGYSIVKTGSGTVLTTAAIDVMGWVE